MCAPLSRIPPGMARATRSANTTQPSPLPAATASGGAAAGNGKKKGTVNGLPKKRKRPSNAELDPELQSDDDDDANGQPSKLHRPEATYPLAEDTSLPRLDADRILNVLDRSVYTLPSHSPALMTALQHRPAGSARPRISTRSTLFLKAATVPSPAASGRREPDAAHYQGMSSLCHSLPPTFAHFTAFPSCRMLSNSSIP